MTGEVKDYLKVAGGIEIDGSLSYNSANGLSFGDGDTGLYENADDSLVVKVSNISKLIFNTEGLIGVNAAGPAFLNQATTATNPTLVTNRADTDTGIGSSGADALSLIAGAIECLRVEEGANGTAGTHILIKNLTTAPTGNPTDGGYLYVEAGALKYKGSSGTVTTLGNA